jgi:hypothetical protein
MDLKCLLCVDQHIADGGSDPEGLPDACTLVTVIQNFNVGVQQMAVPVTMAVCYGCRKKQLAPVSKNGLVTA